MSTSIYMAMIHLNSLTINALFYQQLNILWKQVDFLNIVLSISTSAPTTLFFPYILSLTQGTIHLWPPPKIASPPPPPPPPNHTFGYKGFMCSKYIIVVHFYLIFHMLIVVAHWIWPKYNCHPSGVVIVLILCCYFLISPLFCFVTFLLVLCSALLLPY